MGWTTVSLPGLKATGANSRLSLVSRTEGSFGAVVDEIQLKRGDAGNRVFVAVADITGDGVSDVIWKRPADGAYSAWVLRADGSVASRPALLTDRSMQLAATGDFNADGTEDLVWRNATTGVHTLWRMRNGRAASQTVLAADPSWRLAATDPTFDANNDGRTDLVWLNPTTKTYQLWIMMASGPISKRALGGGSVAGQSLVGVGDFDGDGHGDVLWRAPSTGQVTQQLLKKGVVASAATIGGSLDQSVALTGDVNGDRKTDIVWNTRSTGRNATALMNGSVRIATWAALGNATRRTTIRRPGV